MSRIAGFFRRREHRVCSEDLKPLIDAMKARAPDGTRTTLRRCVGLAQLELRNIRRIPPVAEAEIVTLDGLLFIAADVRLDGRSALIGSLKAHGCPVQAASPDEELILWAYRTWGADRFASELLGDFAFVIWDEEQKEAICVRDHFGVRPFYYALDRDRFIFASNLDAVIAHPEVDRSLEDTSIADFLLFGLCQEPAATLFRHVRCLPPATVLRVSSLTSSLSRYWQWPEEDPPPSRLSTAEYAEEFSRLLALAVADRLPAGPVATQLSGGMDSTAIAAFAAGAAADLHAFNLDCSDMLPQDEETRFARMVAEQLDIPLHVTRLGDYEMFQESSDPALATDSPLNYAFLACHRDFIQQVNASGARVLLSGHGGDIGLVASNKHYADLWHQRQYGGFAGELIQHVWLHRSIKAIGLRAVFHAEEPATIPLQVPDWIDAHFARKVQLEERWVEGWRTMLRNMSISQQVQHPWQSRGFESLESLRQPVLVRYPFYDLRLLDFERQLPHRLRFRKYVLRRIMKGRLPEAVRLRPKTGLQGDPVRFTLKNNTSILEKELAAYSGDHLPICSERFTNAVERFRLGEGHESSWSSSVIIGPAILSRWLNQHLERQA